MSRSRVVTVVIMACALLAAILFGAAAVLGWALARPIGVVSGIAALANIALISAPTGPRARRLALVIGATVLVIAAATGAWGFIADVPWWLCLMPIGGAVLMVPEVLDLMATTSQPKPESAAAPPVPPVALPPLAIELDHEPDDHAFFGDRGTSSAPSTPSPQDAAGDAIDDEDTLRHLSDVMPVEAAAVTVASDHEHVTPPSPATAPSAGSPPEQAPQRGRRAVLPDDWDDDWDDDEDDEDEPPMPLGRRAR